MKVGGMAMTLVFLLGSTFMGESDLRAQDAHSVTSADALFAEGHFAKAMTAYENSLESDPDNVHVLVRLGEILLFSNRLTEAETWLTRALEIEEEHKKAHLLMSETLTRRGEPGRAATHARDSGQELRAKQLSALAASEQAPMVGGLPTTVPFERTDPLPVVKASVNGNEPVYFIIDTGGAELILDPMFAEEMGAEIFGEGEGEYAGGKKAATGLGLITEFQLGDVRLTNVPIATLDTRSFAAAAGGLTIRGVIGTRVLYGFLATLDYPGGELVLRSGTEKAFADWEKRNAGGTVVSIPFWMAGDHYMVAWGRVNEAPPTLFFVDTGLAGGGFACPPSTMELAGIDLEGAPSFDGVGGGGTVTVTPFVVKELSLGDITRSNVTSFAGVFPPSLENQFGFRIGGLISHSYFRPYSLTIDFDRMELHLVKAADDS